jgi:glycine betaine/proline transport system substrate-binding protein
MNSATARGAAPPSAARPAEGGLSESWKTISVGDIMRFPLAWRRLVLCALLPLGALAADESRPLRLVVNPWPASALNVEVASQLLTREFGRRVTPVEADEQAQWELLAKGEADAVLELWPSGHRAHWQRYVVERRVITPGGPLGVRGRIGWFTTRATIEKHPAAANWRGLGAGGVAGVFAKNGGERGRLLTGDPSWTQYDHEIIANLGLRLDVTPLGSEEALVAEVRRAAAAGEPVLFYFYTPHALHGELDLVMVELPRHDPDQWTKAGRGGAACAYPAEPLTKLFSAGLAEADPVATAFLRAMRYDKKAQIEMLTALSAGRTPTEAAAAWIKANEATWRPWVEAARLVANAAR